MKATGGDALGWNLLWTPRFWRAAASEFISVLLFVFLGYGRGSREQAAARNTKAKAHQIESTNRGVRKRQQTKNREERVFFFLHLFSLCSSLTLKSRRVRSEASVEGKITNAPTQSSGGAGNGRDRKESVPNVVVKHHPKGRRSVALSLSYPLFNRSHSQQRHTLQAQQARVALHTHSTPSLGHAIYMCAACDRIHPESIDPVALAVPPACSRSVSSQPAFHTPHATGRRGGSVVAEQDGGYARLLDVALTHGLVIAALIAASASCSGGHLNPRSAAPRKRKARRGALAPFTAKACYRRSRVPSCPRFLLVVHSHSVTLAFLVTGQMKLLGALVYMLAQVFGGMTGAGLAYGCLPGTNELGADAYFRVSAFQGGSEARAAAALQGSVSACA